MIPRNARNIRVEEVTGVDNYLALQNDNGEYYLNGHWFIQWSGDYNIAGTVVRYNRLGNRDSFDAAGPITEPLHIMVVRLPLLNFTQFLLISGYMLFLLTWIYFLTLIFCVLASDANPESWRCLWVHGAKRKCNRHKTPRVHMDVHGLDSLHILLWFRYIKVLC